MKLPAYTHRMTLAMVLCATIVMLWPNEASAQRRGRPVRGRVSTVVVAPLYYGYGFYDPFWSGYGGWYPHGMYWPAYQPPFPHSNVGSARLQVTPRDAEVYVDGYLAGNVDDFDGFLQRLDVPAGAHEITLFLDGYRTVRQKVLFRRGATVKIAYVMQPLGAGETPEPRPQAPPDDAVESGPPIGRPEPPRTAAGDTAGSGAIAIRVQPRDATILVDGEEWSFPEGPGPITIDVGEGSHEVEVRKEGLTPYRRTVRVRAGETVALNVSLTR